MKDTPKYLIKPLNTPKDTCTHPDTHKPTHTHYKLIYTLKSNIPYHSVIRCDMLILVESHFVIYCGRLHQPTMITGNDVIDDITGHVTHINKQSGNTIKREDLDVLSEDQMVVLQEPLSIDSLKF